MAFSYWPAGCHGEGRQEKTISKVLHLMIWYCLFISLQIWRTNQISLSIKTI